METKSHTVELKAQGEGIIEAYAATFNGVDSYGDTIRPGAFLKTIAENGPAGSRRIRVLQNHEAYQMPIGTPQALSEDANGLFTVTKMSQTQAGRDVYTLAQEGAINELSIGWMPIKFQTTNPDQAGYSRELQEVKLIEYSFLTLLPADIRATITAVKSTDDLERLIRQARAVAELNLSTKAGRTLSGANAKRVLAALKELQDLISEAGLDEAADPSTSDAPTSEKSSREPPTHSPLLTALQTKAHQLKTENDGSGLLADLRRFGVSLGGTV